MNPSCSGPTRVTAVYKIGDLVHIPQAVKLIDYEDQPAAASQLMIPLRVHETQKPEVALVIDSSDYGYLRVLWAGKTWSVRNESVYGLNGVVHD
jgi:hypothetical protein